MYFVIKANEDEICLEVMDKETLNQQLNSEDISPYCQKLQPGDDIDLGEEEGMWIIEGKSVVPKSIKAVEKYEI